MATHPTLYLNLPIIEQVLCQVLLHQLQLFTTLQLDRPLGQPRMAFPYPALHHNYTGPFITIFPKRIPRSHIHRHQRILLLHSLFRLLHQQTLQAISAQIQTSQVPVPQSLGLFITRWWPLRLLRTLLCHLHPSPLLSDHLQSRRWVNMECLPTHP